MEATFNDRSDRFPGLKPGRKYVIEFRTEKTLVFVEVGFDHSIVHPSWEDFSSCWTLHSKKKPKTVRKTTDFDSTMFFSTSEAAEFLGVSTATIKVMTRDGRLPVHHRVNGKNFRFAREDVVSLLSSWQTGAY